MNEFIFNTSTKNLNNDTLIIGVIKNGMKKYGFNTIGVANNNGSFTAKHTGTNVVLPTAFNCFDYANNMNKNGTTRVAPVPPIVPTKFPSPTVNTLEACSPALNNAKFASTLA